MRKLKEQEHPHMTKQPAYPATWEGTLANKLHELPHIKPVKTRLSLNDRTSYFHFVLAVYV